MAEWVLDSSAILAWLLGETGGEKIPAIAGVSIVSAVNLSEVLAKLLDAGQSEAVAGEQTTGFEVVAADAELGLRAGMLRNTTRRRGLSLGDRFCLALAQRENLPVLTADRAWADLDLGVEVVLIR